jgi:alanine racemase
MRLTIDLGAISTHYAPRGELDVGEHVETIGGLALLEELEASAGVSRCELLTNPTARAQRIYR